MEDDMGKTVVSTERAPKAIGPYVQATRVGELVFCSGQIALDPATGEMTPGGVEAETARVLDNLEAVLAAAGCALADVVRTTIYLADMNDFAVVNRIYGERFADPQGAYPARATVQVAALPKGARVEIDAIAHSAGERR
jgi:2-iminobutanoate/2-iminopropanoate deaminase